MEPDKLPPWGDDPLSGFLATAEHNIRVTTLKWPDVYAVQQRAHTLLARISELTAVDPGDVHLLVPRLLITRSHSAILAAMRSAMSGQAFEAQPLLRVALEEAWYALHVATDSAPPKRAKIWWNRGDSPAATQACKDEFTVKKVRDTHERIDPATAAATKHLYEDTIDLGGHPNQRGVASSLVLDRSRPDAAVFRAGGLDPGTPFSLATLKAAVDVAIGSAKTAGLIYPERFRIAGVDGLINRLVRQSAGCSVDVPRNCGRPARRPEPRRPDRTGVPREGLKDGLRPGPV
jgi:hypothetical protein